MLAKVSGCATPALHRTSNERSSFNGASVVGLDGALVDVEVDISNGQPGLKPSLKTIVTVDGESGKGAEETSIERLIALVEEGGTG